MLTIKWKVLSVYCTTWEDGAIDFVSRVYWGCFASDVNTEGDEINAEDRGAIDFIPIEGRPVLPRSDVTDEMMLEWCWANGCDKAAVEADVIAKLYG